MFMHRMLAISVLFSALLGLSSAGFAQDSKGEEASASEISPAQAKAAATFIRTKHNKVRAVLRRPDTPKRAEELTVLLGEFLDYEKLARLSLDREWDKRTPKQRAEFVSLLRQLVERQYQRNMESTLKYKVSWVGTEPVDADSVIVKSSARSVQKKRQPAITIDYTMSPVKNEWRVWDIATDGVSLVKNYRRQFRRVIKEEGWNGLIARMERRLNSTETPI
ncbi:MAG: ABC transporter substrate-binding protein [Myxococcota bacterium]